MDADSLEREILRRIVPSDEEIRSVEDKASKLEELIRQYDENHGFDIKIKFAGSFSKGTFLSNPDLDVFLMFPRDIDRRTMIDEGLSVGESLLDNAERAFAENPYISGFFGGLDVDMVPCYELPDATHIITSMDRTPFHTDFIISRLDAEGKDQVRLLKKFMKGIGAYGAEPSSRGFSGYLCELLVVRYGSFREVLRAATAWGNKPRIFIDKMKGPAMDSAVVFYDPVDTNRNVASAVYEDTLCLFEEAARDYLDDPREEFFFPRKRTAMERGTLRDSCSERGVRLISLSFAKPDILEDSIHAQIWKTQYAVVSKMESYGFKCIRAHHVELESTFEIAVELECDELSPTCKRIGPPVWVGNASDFLKKWENNRYGEPFIDNGRWNVIVDRQYHDVKTMLVSETANSGIGKNLDTFTMKVRDHEETLEETDRGLLTELLFPIMPWNV